MKILDEHQILLKAVVLREQKPAFIATHRQAPGRRFIAERDRSNA
jgi:hypothetical protein